MNHEQTRTTQSSEALDAVLEHLAADRRDEALAALHHLTELLSRGAKLPADRAESLLEISNRLAAWPAQKRLRKLIRDQKRRPQVSAQVYRVESEALDTSWEGTRSELFANNLDDVHPFVVRRIETMAVGSAIYPPIGVERFKVTRLA